MKDRIINAPARIWLNYGPGIVGEVNHKDCREMSWHDERIDRTDVQYVRLDLVEEVCKAAGKVCRYWDREKFDTDDFCDLMIALRKAVREAKAKGGAK